MDPHPHDNPPGGAPLNPALKPRTDLSHDTERVTPAPIDTASSRVGGGEGWPWIWLAVVVVCVALTVYLFV